METTTKQEGVMQLELDAPVQHPAPAPTRQRQPKQQQHTPTTPMDLIAAASARGASAEEIGKLMDLLERQQRLEAEQAFARAMVAFKKVVPTIIKNAEALYKDKNERTVNYDFATLGHICEKLIVALADCGISHHWTPDQPSTGPDANMICMNCTLTHEMGHSKSAMMKFPADPTGNKNALQAIGSGATYGERYSLLAVCGIAVKSQGDDDGAGAAPRPDDQPEARARSSKPADVAAAKNGSAKQSAAPEALVKLARDAADQGVAKFGLFWKACTQKERDQLRPAMAELEQRYKEAGAPKAPKE